MMSTSSNKRKIHGDSTQVKATRSNPFGLQKNEKSPKASIPKLTIGNTQLNKIDKKSKLDKKIDKIASKCNMSSTKNSNKRKNIPESSEVSSTKRQKICKNVTAK